MYFVCAVVFLLLVACSSAHDETLPTPTSTDNPKIITRITSTATRSSKIITRITPLAAPVGEVGVVPAATPAVSPASPVCHLANLLPGQHVSASGSYTETETSAAGPMICRIRRNSCAYYQMIGNLDQAIIFKREETPPYDKEDILIHPDVLLPLTRLSRLVEAEWGGTVRLRVTDAYDSLLEHDLSRLDESRRYSLHFEGRSVDLTTWPVDKARYGRLCALAHCAGFSWVNDEGDHCHASLRAESLCLRCSN